MTRSITARPTASPAATVHPAQEAEIGGGLIIRRALPVKGRRLVGPWCFLDHFGPLQLEGRSGLDVGPHPHIGLQTVTWLLAGEVLHRDSLGSEQVIRPGQLNIMTAGRGIAHSEESPRGAGGVLHGVQLWVALPEAERDRAPAFDHHPGLPLVELPRLGVTVLIGETEGSRSPARAYSPIVALDLDLQGGDAELPLRAEFEHALLVLEGSASSGGQAMVPGALHYLPAGRPVLELSASTPTRALLVGGTPFSEDVLMWWNFVARRPEEIEVARQDWMQSSSRFGEVPGYAGDRLPAPASPWSAG